MRRFKNILVCARGRSADRLALEAAVDLAERNQGRATVVNVVRELPRQLMRLSAAIPPENLRAMAMEDARKRMAEFVAAAGMDPTAVAAEILYGKPFIEIVHAVQHHHHDLVILVGGEHKGFKEWFIGSTSLQLLRKCPCPVWVIHPAQPKRLSRILAAVDPDPLDVVRDGVNTQVMELAISLAELNGSELHVVHAWQPLDQMLLRGWRTEVTESQAQDWNRQTATNHQILLHQLLARFALGSLTVHSHLIEGEAKVVIPELVAKEQMDLLVMGTLARAGLEGLFIGNTAETVLHRVACSVLAVKPEGFVSPILAG